MILVTGAIGKIGREAVRLLGPVRTLVRAPSGGAGEVVGDFDHPETLDPALRGVDTLLLIGPAVAAQIAVLDRAAAQGVRHVVRITNHKAYADSPVTRRREHARIDAHLKASGMEYTLLAPNFFMQNLLALAPEIAATGGFSSSVGDGRIGMIDARDVAAAAAAIAVAPESHGGRTYLLTGPELVTFADVAREWASVSGCPWSTGGFRLRSTARRWSRTGYRRRGRTRRFSACSRRATGLGCRGISARSRGGSRGGCGPSWRTVLCPEQAKHDQPGGETWLFVSIWLLTVSQQA
ncbi:MULTISPECIES: NmrA family NAD(P)-binding protein [Actinomycetes]|uniref:NAD(P)H-binding protein n=1 Tax=Actinomycetes TaxID=1760 RepID=UPI0018FE5F93|nr:MULTISPECIES: NmrA family NAD(P)-binding protein [Actinomycetes]